ncbi:T. brucei spp.-specific protein [Trypanosoma brucei gambiense DAL972]|uniref:T. brucei spp.-specific protein n=2 Tax=Trypanosoma brucei TaxID=5691 RepID=D0A2W5_TRYB9|nr:T. brucei spp.-specific protein [Trypanosoma brucei gambiense DAL972]RHW69186.1 hypothetical protein DPX39_100062700 [Trypanosoma brucei equiperdum]CBH15609.1 T. brucei spp.-specific protein [Trypanosoma brucei gambiense DAL972]|eukprot:XP_011777873.1 T. brucei spp.-specific protein [Trypanosoma brucei gambiense DAL972]
MPSAVLFSCVRWWYIGVVMLLFIFLQSRDAWGLKELNLNTTFLRQDYRTPLKQLSVDPIFCRRRGGRAILHFEMNQVQGTVAVTLTGCVAQACVPHACGAGWGNMKVEQLRSFFLSFVVVADAAQPSYFLWGEVSVHEMNGTAGNHLAIDGQSLRTCTTASVIPPLSEIPPDVFIVKAKKFRCQMHEKGFGDSTTCP